jgi:hypothetical protein
LRDGARNINFQIKSLNIKFESGALTLVDEITGMVKPFLGDPRSYGKPKFLVDCSTGACARDNRRSFVGLSWPCVEIFVCSVHYSASTEIIRSPSKEECGAAKTWSAGQLVAGTTVQLFPAATGLRNNRKTPHTGKRKDRFLDDLSPFTKNSHAFSFGSAHSSIAVRKD